MSHAVD